MKKNTFLEGALFASIAIILTKVLGVLYVIPFYKMIGTDGGALYGYAYNIYNLFLIISSAGIPLAISKVTSELIALKKSKQKEYMFKLAQKIILATSIVCFLICFIFAKDIAHLIIGEVTGKNSINDIAFVIRCVSFAILVVPNLSITRGYLQGHKYIKDSSFSQVIEQLVRIFVIIVGVYVAIHVFKTDIKTAVGVAVSGATAGALITYLYLTYKKKKYIEKEQTKDITKDEKKEVLKKILMYSLPFIIISAANNLYNTTDMILLIRGLDSVGINGVDIETISSVFTTWGSKLTSIVTAISTGLVMSLIPAVVSSYTLNKVEDVNKNFNKALQLLLFVVLPLSIFTSIFAGEIWSIFYAEKDFGPIIMKLYFLVAFFDGSFTVMCSTLNAMNKFKFVYFIVLVGLGLNALLDVPLIHLCNKAGIYPHYGALLATLIGYSISIALTLIYLHKNYQFDYKDTFKKIPRLLLTIVLLIVIAYAYERFIPHSFGKLLTMVYLAVIGLICAAIYYLLNKKTLDEIIVYKLKKSKK